MPHLPQRIRYDTLAFGVPHRFFFFFFFFFFVRRLQGLGGVADRAMEPKPLLRQLLARESSSGHYILQAPCLSTVLVLVRELRCRGQPKALSCRPASNQARVPMATGCRVCWDHFPACMRPDGSFYNRLLGATTASLQRWSLPFCLPGAASHVGASECGAHGDVTDVALLASFRAADKKLLGQAFRYVDTYVRVMAATRICCITSRNLCSCSLIVGARHGPITRRGT